MGGVTLIVVRVVVAGAVTTVVTGATVTLVAGGRVAAVGGVVRGVVTADAPAGVEEAATVAACAG